MDRPRLSSHLRQHAITDSLVSSTHAGNYEAYLRFELATNLHALWRLLGCLQRRGRIQHIDVCVTVLHLRSPSFLRVFVELYSTTGCPREPVGRDETIPVGCSNYIFFICGFRRGCSVGIRILIDNHLACVVVGLEFGGILTWLALLARTRSYEGNKRTSNRIAERFAHRLALQQHLPTGP